MKINYDNIEHTQTTIDIHYNCFQKLAVCKVDYGACMKVDSDGQVDFGSPTRTTSEQLHLRDYIQSIFRLTDLFHICQAQYEHEQLKMESWKKDKMIKRLEKKLKESK